MGTFGSEAVISVVNGMAAGGTQSSQYMVTNNGTGVKKVLSGDLDPNTYKEILSVSGAGWLDICGASVVDTTSRIIGLKIVLDGVTVFDAVSNAISATEIGLNGIGCVITTSSVPNWIPQPTRFLSSMAIWVKSSLDETDKVNALYIYRLTAS